MYGLCSGIVNSAKGAEYLRDYDRAHNQLSMHFFAEKSNLLIENKLKHC
jgi:hypothetical protein